MLAHLRAQIAELSRDPALRIFGAALAFTHVLTFAYWNDRHVIEMLVPDAEAICWPLVPGCERLRVLSWSGLRALLTGYVGLAVAVLVLFLQRGRTRLAYAGLLLLEIVKAAVVLLDFRLRMNQHTMASFATLAFLFVPHKRDALRVLVVLFYFWAGTLKLDRDWLAGQALYGPLSLLTGRAMLAACAYAVLLELVIAWGLFAKRRWIFWSTLAQLALFHAMSWPVVGFFYPLIMFALLSIHPLCRVLSPRDSPDASLAMLARGRAPRSVYVLAGAFSILQLVPHAFPGDRAITGEGRLFALHMFDARTACDGWAELRFADGTRTTRDLKLPLDTRIACDPLVFYNRAKNLCRSRTFEDLDLHLWSRRVSQPDARPVIRVHDFCRSDVRYDAFRHNAWIATD